MIPASPKVMLLLLPVIGPVVCIWVIFAFCALDCAATLSLPSAAAAAAAPAGAFATALASLASALTTLTSQHLVTTQVATTGQHVTTGHGQQQTAAVVQLVH